MLLATSTSICEALGSPAAGGSAIANPQFVPRGCNLTLEGPLDALSLATGCYQLLEHKELFGAAYL